MDPARRSASVSAWEDMAGDSDAADRSACPDGAAITERRDAIMIGLMSDHDLVFLFELDPAAQKPSALSAGENRLGLFRIKFSSGSKICITIVAHSPRYSPLSGFARR
jgi:hypothetical protein